MLRSHRAVPASILSLAAASLAMLPLAGLSAPALAAPLDRGPGATLVFPYFKVDLGNSDGTTTLVAISNVTRSRVLAHAVVWSDWGLPVYAWDFYLPEGAVVTYNLRDLLANGTLPPTQTPPGNSLGCAVQLAPSLDPPALVALQRRLTGRPDETSGLCSSEPRLDAAIATGSLTIDVVRACTAPGGPEYPTQTGYFDGERALAAATQALSGDYFLVDPGDDLAEGYDAYALGIGPATGESFWEGRERTDLRREPLPTRWRLRFLEGGPFDAKTSLFVYHRRPVELTPGPCAATLGSPHDTWAFDAFTPAGEKVLSSGVVASQSRRTTARLSLAEVLAEAPGEILAAQTSGSVDFYTYHLDGPDLTLQVRSQSVLFGATEARGRFGAGIAATPLD